MERKQKATDSLRAVIPAAEPVMNWTICSDNYCIMKRCELFLTVSVMDLNTV